MEHDPHTGFIVAAYLVALAVVATMLIVILSDHSTLKRQLRRLGDRSEGRARPDADG